MNIVTTIFYSEVKLPRTLTFGTAGADPVEVLQIVETEVELAGRQWVSIFEGKNRVLPFDHEQ